MKCHLCGVDSANVRQLSAGTSADPAGWLQGVKGAYCPICVHTRWAKIRALEDPTLPPPQTQPEEP